jgi:hypothetical protein
MKYAFRNVLAVLLFTSAPALTAELPKEGTSITPPAKRA